MCARECFLLPCASVSRTPRSESFPFGLVNGSAPPLTARSFESLPAACRILDTEPAGSARQSCWQRCGAGRTTARLCRGRGRGVECALWDAARVEVRALRLLNPNALIRLSAERPPALPSQTHLCVRACVRAHVCFCWCRAREIGCGDGWGSFFKSWVYRRSLQLIVHGLSVNPPFSSYHSRTIRVLDILGIEVRLQINTIFLRQISF